MTDHDPDYCEKCQEEAFIQRLGKDLYDDLDRRSRMRPPIEDAKIALEEKRDAHFCHISQGTIETFIAICDYALELEAKGRRPRMRPPIEEMRRLWIQADIESFANEIALCNYALELEAKGNEAQDA